MRQLLLTGLGNEVDLKTGRMVFTAVFNENIRIEISKEAAQSLTSAIYAGGNGGGTVTASQQKSDYDIPPVSEEVPIEGEEFGGNGSSGMPVLEDAPSSVYDSDTGIEQV